MDPSARRFETIVREALAKPPAGRRAFVLDACGADPVLVLQVTRTIDAIESSEHEDARWAAVPAVRIGEHAIGEEIGRGGMGVVYEVATPPGAPPLALKVIRPSFVAEPAARERFLREARLGLRVAHENVVRTLDVGEVPVGGATFHYLVMERVRGKTLRALLDEMKTVPEVLARELARQAARGLCALHEAGVVHRDVKPENLLLADDRRLRITDLGIAKASDSDSSLTSEGQFVGSLRYAAPEQVDGREVGPAADLYSLGVVLFELVAGSPPFAGEGLLEIVKARAETSPPPLLSRAPGTSPFLSEVVSTLLDPVPARRFASASDLARALDEGESGAWWASRRREQASKPPRPAPPPPSVPTVGRRLECGVLLEAWRAARRGDGQVVLVRGEAGIGKSRLVEDFLRAVAGEADVLVAGFRPGGDARGIRDALVARLSSSDLDADVARRLHLPIGETAPLTSFLRRVAPPDAVQRLSPQEGAGAVVRLVHSLAGDVPVVFVVEDLQFATADSRRTVLSLARGAAGHRVLVVATARPDFDAAAAADLAQVAGARTLDLSRLSEDDVRALIAHAVGDATLADRLHALVAPRADGVPFFVLEMVRELERRGHVVRDASGRARLAQPVEHLDVPSALRDVLRLRLRALSTDERATLDVAAVEGDRFEPDLLARVRGVPRLSVLEVLTRLEREHGIVENGPRASRFAHHLMQEVVYADLSVPLRAEIHARLADAIVAEATAAPRDDMPAVSVARVAGHRLRGPDPESAAPLVREAIAEHERTYRTEAVLDVAKRALGLRAFAAGPERVEVLLHLASAAIGLGRPRDAEASLAEATRLADATGDRALRLRAWSSQASAWTDVGRYAEALAASEAALAAAKASHRPLSQADALGRRGQVLWCLGRHREARADHEAAIRLAHEIGDTRQEAQGHSNLGVVLHETGFMDEAERHYLESIRLMRACADRRGEATSVGNLGNLMSVQGRRAEALAYYEAALALDRSTGSVVGEAYGWVNIGATRLALGDLDGALAAFSRCEEICRAAGLRRVEGFAIHGRGQAAAWSGDRAAARTFFDAALGLRRAIDNRGGVSETLVELGILDAGEGREVEARARFDEATAVADAMDDPATAVLARLRKSFLPGESPASARAAFEANASRIRNDVKVEALWLLWRHDHRPDDLAAAKALLDEQVRYAPPEFAASLVTRVPHLRGIAQASAG